MIEKYFTQDIEIQRLTPTDNGFGGVTETWNTYLNIKGRIRPISGNEKLTADKTTLYATHRLYCNVVDIKETDRVVFNGEIYRIKFISNPMNFNRFLQIDLELVGVDND